MQNVGGGIRNRVDHHQIAEAFQQILHEPARILTRLDNAVNGTEDRGGITGGEGIHDVVEEGRMSVTEQCHCEVIRHTAIVRTGHELVQHGQRIADRTAAGANHQGQDSGLRGHVLLLAQLLQVLHEGLRRNQTERVVVGARANGGEHLGRLGGRKDELHVLRRLLHDLEEGVEALTCDHVRLINDEDLEAIPHRGKSCAFTQVTRVVNTTVGRGVHLDDVQ